MMLSTELARWQDEIRQKATNNGLDFFEVIFEVVDFDQMNQLAAYSGFPTRYPHWSFGMEYERLRRSYDYGLQRIYEMVINNDPSYAYLLDSNQLIDQKIVMAHVYGHSDFFKNNLWFAHTNRKMLDEKANHAARIRRHMDRYGEDEVEDFIDACLSLENLIDPHLPGIRRRPPLSSSSPPSEIGEAGEEPEVQPARLPAKSYMDQFINPPEVLAREAGRLKAEQQARKRKLPAEPEKDVLLFLLENAPLDAWQQDVLSIVREEAYYFAPQRQTKITNEGWASYHHSQIMTQSGVMTDAEVIDYADHHSGTIATGSGRLNPYKLGLELYRDIEDRWNKGRFGKEYEECDDIVAKARWDQRLGLGRDKIFEVRQVYNDIGLIDTFLTEEFCVEHKLFSYHYNERRGQYEIESREFERIKARLLFQLTNFGAPYITVENGNYANRGELLLVHRHEGIDLDIGYARDTLQNVHRLWGRPVHVQTVVEGSPRLFTYDGTEHKASKVIDVKRKA
jgi:stage V sporulation protein R